VPGGAWRTGSGRACRNRRVAPRRRARRPPVRRAPYPWEAPRVAHTRVPGRRRRRRGSDFAQVHAPAPFPAEAVRWPREGFCKTAYKNVFLKKCSPTPEHLHGPVVPPRTRWVYNREAKEKSKGGGGFEKGSRGNPGQPDSGPAALRPSFWLPLLRASRGAGPGLFKQSSVSGRGLACVSWRQAASSRPRTRAVVSCW
jgi:hypothetical protein